jgi:gas vesicle protein
MTNHTKNSKGFSLGLAVGAIVGAVAAFFLTPTSGEENRRKARNAFQKLKKLYEEGELEVKAREVFGEVTEEGKRLLAEVRGEFETRIAGLKDQLDDFDREKFNAFVDETVSAVSAKVKVGAGYVEKLKNTLASQWECEEKKVEKAKKVLKPRVKIAKTEEKGDQG